MYRDFYWAKPSLFRVRALREHSMNISFHYFRSLLFATCFFAFAHPAMGATFVSEYGAYNSANSVYLEFPAGGGYPSSVWAPTGDRGRYYDGICNAVTEQTVWSVSDGLSGSEIGNCGGSDVLVLGWPQRGGLRCYL